MFHVNKEIHEIAAQLLYFIDSRYVDIILTLLGYLILAKIVDLVIDRLLKRLADLTRIGFDNKFIDFVHKPLVLNIVLLGLLHISVASSLKEPWDFIVPNLIKTMIFFAWWFPLLRLVATTDLKDGIFLAKRQKVARELLFLFRNIIRITVLAAGLIAVLLIWHVNLTPLFASAGIVGIAVAIAAKDTLANLFGGISIFMDRPYKIGDYIILGSGERGEVVDIGIRSTRMMTRDDVLITIPNSIMANAKIINESAPIPRFRIRVPVGVAYGSDLKQVEQLLVNISLDNPDVVPQPEPRSRVRRFGASAIDFELLCWVKDPRFKGRAIHQLLKAIYARFEQEGISIPFPQHDVHLVGHQPGDS